VQSANLRASRPSGTYDSPVQRVRLGRAQHSKHGAPLAGQDSQALRMAVLVCLVNLVHETILVTGRLGPSSKG
jgi:hypothetical protein